MATTARRRNVLAQAISYGIVPFVLGVGFGQYLRWSGYVWLTVGGGFWPLFCALCSILAYFYLALAKGDDRTLRFSAWLMLTWTWLYVPFWVTAVGVPAASAVVGPDGRVSMVNERTRAENAGAWLFAGRGDTKIVRNVEGTATIHSVDIKYRFADSFVAQRSDGEDLAKLVANVMTAALAREIAKPRLARIALFETKSIQSRLLADVCDAVVHGKSPCPLTMTLAPAAAATLPGSLWSKQFTEQEAIEEAHLPTLINLLTQDNLRVVRKQAAYDLFMKTAKTEAELASVALKPSLLDDAQFDALIDRIATLPRAGNAALSIFVSVSRLSSVQRQTLRVKAFNEADIANIIKQYGSGRLADTELAQLSARIRLACGTTPEVAILVLQAFGERLPADLQKAAVESVMKARVSDAITALKYLNFSNPMRQLLLRKVIAEATSKDLDDVLPQQRIEDWLTPAEVRELVASIVKHATSRDWLDLAVKTVPARSMTPQERKMIVDELMFVNSKAALEFVSENRQHLNETDVLEITRDYARTVTPDFCLHLTHRNTNRQAEYFNTPQVEIFRKCAQSK